MEYLVAPVEDVASALIEGCIAPDCGKLGPVCNCN